MVKYKEQTTRLATLTMGKRESKAAMDDCKSELEQRLHAHLDKRGLVTRRANQLFVDITGVFPKKELNRLALGVKRVWEWEAA